MFLLCESARLLKGAMNRAPTTLGWFVGAPFMAPFLNVIHHSSLDSSCCSKV
jgi:hypothetical protein